MLEESEVVIRKASAHWCWLPGGTEPGAGLRLWLRNHNGAEVIDIGQRRSGHDLIAKRSKEGMRVVAGETVGGG